ncbi:hypothetical protein Pcinc_040616 [Petrolisthes cinctipes]|uniref:Uncharacterized protein n=1 Tax=Petrolisthes cinctipes TaxID=88211 RepID=A0AAE1EHT1_PETCI|nr:hypothetical protein Pcinc_040616 [Petrolisthes cinctipes]
MPLLLPSLLGCPASGPAHYHDNSLTVSVQPETRQTAVANARIKTLKENAFSVRAPLIFNALPRYLRESTEHLDGFKNQLDKFLRTIPDQPKLPHYHLSAASNSIIDQLAQRRADGLY